MPVQAAESVPEQVPNTGIDLCVPCQVMMPVHGTIIGRTSFMMKFICYGRAPLTGLQCLMVYLMEGIPFHLIHPTSSQHLSSAHAVADGFQIRSITSS